MAADYRRYFGLDVAATAFLEAAVLFPAVLLYADSATARTLGTAWNTIEQLTAEAVNRLGVLVWQQTKDGAKNRNPPRRIYPPGMEPPGVPDSINLEELKAALNRPRLEMEG